MNDSERAMCSGICARLNTLDTLKWTSSSFFMFIIIATLTLSGRDIIQAKNHKPQVEAKKKDQEKAQDKVEDKKDKNVSAIFTIMTCIMVGCLWMVSLLHFRKWIRYFESCLDRLETAEPNPVTVRVFGGPSYDRLESSLLAADLPLMSMFAILMFILIAAYAYLMLS